MSGSAPSSYDRIYAVVRRIPKGRVATYGQVADLAGLGGHARQVGYALHALRDGSAVPWQRVINARGEVSVRSEPGCDNIQRQFLEAEGIHFGSAGRIDLDLFRWQPRIRAASTRSKVRSGVRAKGKRSMKTRRESQG